MPIERGFAAIGLANKMNSAAAVSRIAWLDARQCEVALRDGGDFLSWVENPPARVEVDGRQTSFDYDARAGALRVSLPDKARHALRIRW